VLVTGGAGFIGSHLVDRVVEEADETIVLDNLSTGRMENLADASRKMGFRFVQGDLLDLGVIKKAFNGCEIVFHMAANPEVRIGIDDPEVDFQQNLVATRNILEAMRLSSTAKHLVFASTSTVYGDATVIPTPEEYGPMVPISLYGASKLGCEALIMAYCHMFDLTAVINRFANVVGSRSRHGVIFDFIQKLRANPTELEFLGDGSQNKSYLLVDDCVNAFLHGLNHEGGRLEVFNVGSEDRVDVKQIAQVVIDTMGLKNTRWRFTGGVDGRGWRGDVKEMQLDITKIRALGWKPKHNSLDAITEATRSILDERH